MKVVPCHISQANELVRSLHRHHRPVLGGLFAVAVDDEGKTVAAAIVGRPVARMIQEKEPFTVEVTRLVSDGTKNACSMLYGACRRAAFALGYTRIITYILDEEPGTSLRAAGWHFVKLTGGGWWDRQNRPRLDEHPLCKKQLWEAIA